MWPHATCNLGETLHTHTASLDRAEIVMERKIRRHRGQPDNALANTNHDRFDNRRNGRQRLLGLGFPAQRPCLVLSLLVLLLLPIAQTDNLID